MKPREFVKLVIEHAPFYLPLAWRRKDAALLKDGMMPRHMLPMICKRVGIRSKPMEKALFSLHARGEIACGEVWDIEVFWLTGKKKRSKRK
jgi:hypothetical protein